MDFICSDSYTVGTYGLHGLMKTCSYSNLLSPIRNRPDGFLRADIQRVSVQYDIVTVWVHISLLVTTGEPSSDPFFR